MKKLKFLILPCPLSITFMSSITNNCDTKEMSLFEVEHHVNQQFNDFLRKKLHGPAQETALKCIVPDGKFILSSKLKETDSCPSWEGTRDYKCDLLFEYEDVLYGATVIDSYDYGSCECCDACLNAKACEDNTYNEQKFTPFKFTTFFRFWTFADENN